MNRIMEKLGNMEKQDMMKELEVVGTAGLKGLCMGKI